MRTILTGVKFSLADTGASDTADVQARRSPAGGVREAVDSVFNRWLPLLTMLVAFLAMFVSVRTISILPLRTYLEDEWVNLTFYFDRGFWPSIVYRHNGHPTFLANLALRVDWLVFGGSPLFRTLTSAGSSCAVGFGLLAIVLKGKSSLIRTYPLRVGSGALVMIALSLWLAMGKELIWTFGFADHSVALGAIVAAFGYMRVQEGKHAAGPGFWIMVLGSVLATFSFGSGLAVWVAFTIMLLVARCKSGLVLGYALAGAIIIVATMTLVPSFGGGQPPELGGWSGIWDRARIVSSVIGAVVSYPLSPFGISVDHRMALSQVFGWLGISALFYQIFAGKFSAFRSSSSLALCAIALAALGAAGLISLARGEGFGETIGLAPRYAPISMLFWMCLLGLMLRYSFSATVERGASATRGQSLANCALLTVSLIVLGSNILYVFHYRYIVYNSVLAAVSLVVDPSPSNTNLLGYYRRAGYMIEVSKRMEAENKGVYKHDFAKFVGKSWPEVKARFDDVETCAGEFAVNERLNQERSIVMEGWGRAVDTMSPVHTVLVVHGDSVVGGGTSIPILRGRWIDEVMALDGERHDWSTWVHPWLRTVLSPGSPTGWLAVARVDAADVQQLRLYGLVDTGRLCRIDPL